MNSKYEQEGFIESLTHPRQIELATMIFEGAEIDAFEAAGYGKVAVLEMVNQIKLNVIGQEELVIEYPKAETAEEAPADDFVADNTSTPESEAAADEEGEEVAPVAPEAPVTPEATTATDAAPTEVAPEAPVAEGENLEGVAPVATTSVDEVIG